MYLAQNESSIGNVRGVGKFELASEGPWTITDVVEITVTILTVVAALWFIFLIVTGGLSILGAGGDKAGLQEGQKKIVNGLVGFVIVLLAMFIFDLVAQLLGLPDFLDIWSIIQNYIVT